MKEDDILIGCLNQDCGILFKLEDMIDASHYEFIPICVCPKCGYYSVRVFPKQYYKNRDIYERKVDKNE